MTSSNVAQPLFSTSNFYLILWLLFCVGFPQSFGGFFLAMRDGAICLFTNLYQILISSVVTEKKRKQNKHFQKCKVMQRALKQQACIILVNIWGKGEDGKKKGALTFAAIIHLATAKWRKGIGLVGNQGLIWLGNWAVLCLSRSCMKIIFRLWVNHMQGIMVEL